jgi:hypothetical protein
MMGISMMGIDVVTGRRVSGAKGGPMFLANRWSLHRGKRQDPNTKDSPLFATIGIFIKQG